MIVTFLATARSRAATRSPRWIILGSGVEAAGSGGAERGGDVAARDCGQERIGGAGRSVAVDPCSDVALSAERAEGSDELLADRLLLRLHVGRGGVVGGEVLAEPRGVEHGAVEGQAEIA